MPQEARSIKGHFDGHAVVLDEPASLPVGQAVRVTVIESSEDVTTPGSQSGSFSPHVDVTTLLMNGEEWDERQAIHVDPLERVPPDFVRKPGSAAGQIQMTPDFDETPDDFKDYT